MLKEIRKEGTQMTIRERLQQMKDERDQRILKKRQEWEQKVKDYYEPITDEEELRRRELARHLDYLKRLKERHDRGEL